MLKNNYIVLLFLFLVFGGAMPLLLSWVVMVFIIDGIGWGFVYATTLVSGLSVIAFIVHTHRKMILDLYTNHGERPS